MEKVFGDFQCLPRFETSLSQKNGNEKLAFSGLEPIFHSSKDSIQTYDRLQNKFIANSDIRIRFLESFNIYFVFPEKWFCIRQPNLAFRNLEPIFHSSKDSIQGFDRPQNKFIGNSDIGRNFLENFKVCLTFPEKWCLYSSTKFGILKP